MPRDFQNLEVHPQKVARRRGPNQEIGLHRLSPPLIEFVRDAVDDIGHPVQANAYITPPGNRGFDFHYDVHDVFVLQVSGTKRWIVHEPVHRHPLPSQPWTDHRDQIAQRVTVLHLGRVFAQDTIAAIIADARVAEIYLGKSHDE